MKENNLKTLQGPGHYFRFFGKTLKAMSGLRKIPQDQKFPPGACGPKEDAVFSDDSPDARTYKKAWAQRFAAGDIANPRLCAKHKTQGPIVVYRQTTPFLRSFCVVLCIMHLVSPLFFI